MFIDLDRFKPINDSLGHSVGDVLLKDVSQRLVNQLRVGDTICRIGGDEFVVVLPEVKRSSDVAQVAQKLIEQVAQPAMVAGRESGSSLARSHHPCRAAFPRLPGVWRAHLRDGGDLIQLRRAG